MLFAHGGLFAITIVPSAGQPPSRYILSPKDKNVSIGASERTGQGLCYVAQLKQDLTPGPSPGRVLQTCQRSLFSKPSETAAKLLIYTPVACKLQACDYRVSGLIKHV